MGERFGPFELMEPLGRGGMAEVWRALYRGESGFAKEVALKRILPERLAQPNLRTWFHDEARLCSRLKHLHIVEVYDFGTIEGTPYLSMEFVRGWTLSQVLRRGRAHGLGLSLPAVIELGIQVCAGLAYAHEATDEDGVPLGVIHRDLKPANLMVSDDGLVKVMDFGIAKAATNEFSTQTDSVRGTPCYLSPEACDGKPVDRRADLFTLGAILAEALLGYPVFLEENTYRTMFRIAQADAARELADVRAVDGDLAELLGRALQREPADRFEDAEAMRYALQSIAGDARGREVLLAQVRKAMALAEPEEDDDATVAEAGGPAATLPGRDRSAMVSESAATRSWEEPDTPAQVEDFEDSLDLALAEGRRQRRWVALGGTALLLALGALALLWWRPWVTPAGGEPATPEPGQETTPAEADRVEPTTASPDDGAATAPGDRDTPTPEPATPPADDAAAGEPAPEPGTDEPATGEGFDLRIPDQEAVGRSIQEDPALRDCFEQSRARGEEAPASVSVVFVMAPEGSFESVAVSRAGTLPGALVACIEGRLAQMRFEESSFRWDGRVTLAYTPGTP